MALSDRTSGANEQKKLVKVFAIICGLVKVWSPRVVIFGHSFDNFWR